MERPSPSWRRGSWEQLPSSTRALLKVENGKRYVLVLNNFFIFPVLSLFFRDVAVNNREDESGYRGHVTTSLGGKVLCAVLEGLQLPCVRGDRGLCAHPQVLPQEQGRQVRSIFVILQEASGKKSACAVKTANTPAARENYSKARLVQV